MGIADDHRPRAHRRGAHRTLHPPGAAGSRAVAAAAAVPRVGHLRVDVAELRARRRDDGLDDLPAAVPAGRHRRFAHNLRSAPSSHDGRRARRLHDGGTAHHAMGSLWDLPPRRHADRHRRCGDAVAARRRLLTDPLVARHAAARLRDRHDDADAVTRGAERRPDGGHGRRHVVGELLPVARRLARRRRVRRGDGGLRVGHRLPAAQQPRGDPGASRRPARPHRRCAGRRRPGRVRRRHPAIVLAAALAWLLKERPLRTTLGPETAVEAAEEGLAESSLVPAASHP